MTHFQSKWDKEDISQKINEDFNLSHIDIGPPIAKGCAAVVYAASLKKDDLPHVEPLKPIQVTTTELPSTPRNEMMSPIQYTSRFLYNLGGSVDNLSFNRPNVDAEFVTPANVANNENNGQTATRIGGGKSVRFNTASNVVHSEREQSVSSDDELYVEVGLELLVNDYKN